MRHSNPFSITAFLLSTPQNYTGAELHTAVCVNCLILIL